MAQVPDSVLDYLKKGVDRGFSLDELSRNLYKEGWSKDQIEASLQEFYRRNASNFDIPPRPIPLNNFKGSEKIQGIPPLLNVASILYFISGALMVVIPILMLVAGASFFGGLGASIGGF